MLKTFYYDFILKTTHIFIVYRCIDRLDVLFSSHVPNIICCLTQEAGKLLLADFNSFTCEKMGEGLRIIFGVGGTFTEGGGVGKILRCRGHL